jgi:hypothetical protein
MVQVYRPPGAAAPAPAPSASPSSAYNPAYNSNQASSSTPSYGYGSSPAAAAAAPYPSSYSNQTPATTTNTTSSYNNAKPDFSQALNVPPPVQTSSYGQPSQPSTTYGGQTASYGQPSTTSYGGQTASYSGASNKAPNDYPSATATGGMVAASTVNSSVYQSGPSGGLISEVRYVLGTMCVISVLVILLTTLLLLKTI